MSVQSQVRANVGAGHGPETYRRGVDPKLQAVVDSIPLPAETLGGVVLGVIAHRLRPRPLPAWTRPVGLLLVCGGLATVVAAWRERGPGSLEEPAALVTRGLHGRSRNPMYVGFTAAQLGLAGVTRNGWMLVTWPASTALLHRWVLREEGWLHARFGAEYDGYRARVPRYL